MLLARRVDSPSRLSRETTREEMAGNVVKRHFICFDLQTKCHSRDAFGTLPAGRSFCSLGFRLFCARLAVHYFAVLLQGA